MSIVCSSIRSYSAAESVSSTKRVRRNCSSPNRRRSARASSSWSTLAMTREKRPRKPERPRGSEKPTGPRRRNLLVVSLEILGQDFHRARHVLALKEKNRICVRRHLFHDVDASGGERAGEKGQEARCLLDRLRAGHIDFHESACHADQVFRAEFLRHPRDRIVVDDDHRAL